MTKVQARVADLPSILAGLIAAALSRIFCPVIDFCWERFGVGPTPKWAEASMPNILGAIGVVATMWFFSYRSAKIDAAQPTTPFNRPSDTFSRIDSKGIATLQISYGILMAVCVFLNFVEATSTFDKIVAIAPSAVIVLSLAMGFSALRDPLHVSDFDNIFFRLFVVCQLVIVFIIMMSTYYHTRVLYWDVRVLFDEYQLQLPVDSEYKELNERLCDVIVGLCCFLWGCFALRYFMRRGFFGISRNTAA